MRKALLAAMVALVASALLVPQQTTLARDRADGRCEQGQCSLSKRAIKGWIELHRPDGEVVLIKVDQIVFVTTAGGTGGSNRAVSKVQLLNGFADVREGIEEVMQTIENAESFVIVAP
jgi:hypothetical protein